MSIQVNSNAVCPKCGQNTVVPVYKSINVAENPELKEKVRDGSLFLWECPHCGSVNLAKYETLYHDPERKLMLWMVSDEDLSEAQMTAITNHTRSMGDYRLRLVRNMGELMEKVLIDEAGLDDVVVEFTKWVIRNEMKGKDGQSEIPVLRFYRIEGTGDDRSIVLSFPKNGQMVGMKIGWNVYEDCAGILERNPSVRPADGFVHIDADWAESRIR